MTNKKKTTAIEPEVLGPDPELGKNLPTVGDEFTERVVNFHVAASQHASAAVLCAAAAGAVMIQKKHTLGHGRGFTKWKESLVLPDGQRISPRTADKYIALAKQMDEKLKLLMAKTPNSHLGANLPKGQVSPIQLLAAFDPTQANDLRQAAMAEAVREVTNAESLTQLYWAWGIVKQSVRTGGDMELQAWLKEHYPKLVGTKLAKLPKAVRAEFEAYVEARRPSDEEIIATERHDANDYWLRLRTTLTEFGIKDNPTWGLLNDQNLLETMVTLETVAKRIKRTLNERGAR